MKRTFILACVAALKLKPGDKVKHKLFGNGD